MKYLVFIFSFVFSYYSYSQNITFKNINTNHGLSSNLVFNACQGPDRLLWIIANHKLDSYNEGKIVNYTNRLIPGIEDFKLAEINIDKQNIIWLRSTEDDILYLDEKRNLHQIDFPDLLPDGMLNFLKREDGRVDILTKQGHFHYDVDSQKLNSVHAFSKPMYTSPGLQISKEKYDTHLITGNGKAILYNAVKGEVVFVFDKVRVTGAAMINDSQFVASTGFHHQLYLVDVSKNEIVKNIASDILADNPSINTYYRRVKHIDKDHIGITSGHQGLFVLNRNDLSVVNHAHDFANPSSISSDNSYFLYANDFGNVFVTSRTSGLNIFNQKRKNATHIKSFIDHKFQIVFEGHISHVVKDTKGHFWLASSQGLLKYDIDENTTDFNAWKGNKKRILSIITMFIDNDDNKWVGVSGGGLAIIDKNGWTARSFKSDKDNSNSIKSNFVYSMNVGIDGKMWVGTSRGLNTFDFKNFETMTPSKLDSTLDLNTAIREVKTIENETFVGTWRKGCFVYTESGRKKIEIPEKLNISNVTAFGKGLNNDLYIGSQKGLLKYAFEDDEYQFESKLLSARILSIDKDRSGKLWISTENILYKLDPSNGLMEEFTHENGFTGGGFRMHASYMDTEGALYYGLNTGMCYFDPAELSSDRVEINPYITGFIENNKKMLISNDVDIKLASQENNIGIYYDNIDIWKDHALRYEYSVSNGNDHWIPAITNPILIQNIESGSYTVLLRASIDGENWTISPNKINLQVAYPWWKSYYFLGFILAVCLAAAYFGIGFLQKLKADKEEEKKYDESLKFFSFSMHKYGDMDQEFWDVILECLRQLDIDASAIYIIEKDSQKLIRQASKIKDDSHRDYLAKPDVIALGKGVIGATAVSSETCIVNDLSETIEGDKQKLIRLSKICVPILSGEEILGVIDCEHEKKDHFNERKLSFISAISTIVATKIIAYNAEEERKGAELSLSNNLKKISQLEMKSLRSQMNPHFMFNSLNSINNFIVKNDQENASDYLTSFAQLMRIILENSRQDWVSLESELNALRLYIGMEKLRFENQFFYHESVSENVNVTATMIPPMLIQPYIENAIWHGLLPKKSSQCNLKLIIEQKDGLLNIIVDDDGIGTKVSKQNKSSFNVSKKSFGMKIISERLDMINKIYNLNARVQLIDKSELLGSETGTKVTLSMKLKMKENESNNHR